jgi:hypothetical protein
MVSSPVPAAYKSRAAHNPITGTAFSIARLMVAFAM